MSFVKYIDYIHNPLGAGTAVMTQRGLYEKLYNDKWDALLLKENGNIAYLQYKKDEDYYIHFKIPSEVIDKFYYDIVIRFYLLPESATYKMDTNLNNYDVQFYSNDPSFVFSFAYAFNKHDAFVDDLKFKISKVALTQEAAVRNPQSQLGYVKAFYFAFLQMKRLMLFSKSNWESAKKYSKSVWNSTVTHSDDILEAIREAKAVQKKISKAKAKRSKVRSATNIQKFKVVSPNPKNYGHLDKSGLIPTIDKPSKKKQNLR